jgi:hypothetical protein
MPKRKISDLWPNECIHCPTHESQKKLFWYDCDFHKRIVFASFEDGRDWLQLDTKPKTIIYPRTDFVDEEEDHTTYSRVNVLDWEKKSSVWFDSASPKWDSTMYYAWWSFKTGDEVEVRDSEQTSFVPGVFSWYTTDWRYIAMLVKTMEDWMFHWYVYNHCRFPIILKTKNAIYCTDEVLEKVKQIEGVDFI